MAVGEKRTLTIETKLKDQIGKDLPSLRSKVKAFADGFTKSWGAISRSVFSVKSAVIALGAAFSVAKVVEFTRATAEQADELGKLAASTGDLIENLSELQAAFDLGGVRDFTGTIRALTKAQSEALQGNEQFVEGFRELNISLEDLRTLGPSQLFERIAQGLDLVGTEQERAVALSKILPRQFLELLPVVGRGIQQFRQAVVDAREVGATITEEQARISEQLNDSFTKVGIAAKNVGRELVRSFGPDVTALLERVSKLILSNREAMLRFAEVIASGVVLAVNLAIEAFIGLIDVIEEIPGIASRLVDQKELDRLQAIIRERRALQASLAQEFSQSLGKSGEQRRKQIIEQSKTLEAEVRSIEAQIEGLEASTKLRNLRDEMARQLQAASEQIRAGVQAVEVQAPPVDPIQNGVPVLDLPSLEGLRAYAEQAAAQVKTVFRSTAGRPRLPDPEQDPVPAAEPAIPQVTEQLREAKVASDDFFGGVNEGLTEAARRWTDLAQAGREAARSLVDGGLTGLTEAFGSIIDGTKSAKEAFKDFATGLLQDIARLIPRLLLVRALGGIFGTPAPAFADGGIGGGVTQTARVRAFARGGVTNGPTWALMGEAGRREAFVPLPDNRSIPVTLTGGGGGGNVVINITAMDGKDVRRVLIEERGTIQRIWTNQMQTRNGARTVVRKAAS